MPRQDIAEGGISTLITTGTEPNDPLDRATDMEHHHTIMSTLGGKVIWLDREIIINKEDSYEVEHIPNVNMVRRNIDFIFLSTESYTYGSTF